VVEAPFAACYEPGATARWRGTHTAVPHQAITEYRSPPSSRARQIIGASRERCVYCDGKKITREGKRHKKYETVQLWYCHTCDRVFTPQRAKGKTYPLKVILESLMLYYRGETREQVARKIRDRFGITVPSRTLSTWLSQHRELTPYTRLRDKYTTTYRPNRIIRAVRLQHQQVYEYRIHQGKLDWALGITKQQHLEPLRAFLRDMAESCPHALFQTDARASQGKTAYDLDAVEIKSRHNLACRAADLVLQTVTINKRRHDEIQRFMLATDSVTVAVEVPIYLQPEELADLKRTKCFSIPLESATTLTGHIDFLQIRNGAIHILDYKPGARLDVKAMSDAHVILVGGAPMDGPRHIWWNFVSSSAERIEAAKADWKAGRFGRVVGDAEFIPLPE